MKIGASRLARRLQSPSTMTNSSATQLAPAGASARTAARDARTAVRASSADLKILARLRAGDESALGELVGRYHAVLLRLALAFYPNRAFAEEVVQDTWTAVVDGLASFEGRSSLKTWICRILTNRAKTRLIREARSVPFSALKDFDSDEPPGSFTDESPEKQLIHKEAIFCLERALQQLPLNQRAVVTLRDVEGLGSEEVCNVLQIRETNQRVLLHRARAKLRRALEEHLIGA